jgi:RNA polymerase sigma factor (sigma-70 family)
MAYKKGEAPILRSSEEAWALALKNEKLLYHTLNKFISSHSLYWYQGVDLRAELESYAWETFYDVALRWNKDKGAFSSYAVKATYNTFLRVMKKLSRLGGNSKSGRKANGEATTPMPTPFVSSMNSIIEDRGLDLNDSDSLALGDEVEFEDQLIDKLDAQRKVKALAEIVSQMEEPYKKIYSLVYFSGLTEPSNTSYRKGLTIQEVGKAVGCSKTTVMKYLAEAEDYVLFQLQSRGLVKEEEEEG